MYRRLLWLAVVCVFIFTAGCDSNTTGEKADSTKKTPTQTEEDTNQDTVSEEPDSNPSPGNNDIEKTNPDSSTGNKENKKDEVDTAAPEIQKATDQDGNRTIHYPQLVNMQGESKEKQMNDLIKNEITSFADQYSDGTLSIDFQIMRHTDDTLSILYHADYMGGAYPTELIFTTNIDLNHGKKMKLSDVALIDKSFVKKLKESPYLDSERPSAPNEEKETAVLDYVNSIEVSELVDALRQADQTTMDANPYGVYSYLQDDFVVVSIGVPHAIGDHAEFRVSLD